MTPSGDAWDRDEVAEGRDRTAAHRDRAADARDELAEQRENWARQRDQAASDRLWAEQVRADARARRGQPGLGAANVTAAMEQWMVEREMAASAAELARQDLREALDHAGEERRQAAADRLAGQQDRQDAERDRAASCRDRDADAAERAQADIDAQQLPDPDLEDH